MLTHNLVRNTVAKGEHSHPYRTLTRVYRVPNMHSDRHAKEPRSMAWQSVYIFICSDSTSSHCPHLREAHPCASRTQAFLAHPPTVLLPSRAPHTSASPIYGVPQTGVNLPGDPSYSFTGMPPMTSRQAIPFLTPFVAKGEHSHPTRTRTRSTGCQTCTLTATPKSQARWHGSQNTFICIDGTLSQTHKHGYLWTLTFQK